MRPIVYTKRFQDNALPTGESIGFLEWKAHAPKPGARGHKPVGHGTLHYGIPHKNGRAAEFVDFEVAPDYRRKGIATAILKRLVQKAIAEKCELLLLAYEPSGEAFWRCHLSWLRRQFDKVNFRKARITTK